MNSCSVINLNLVSPQDWCVRGVRNKSVCVCVCLRARFDFITQKKPIDNRQSTHAMQRIDSDGMKTAARKVWPLEPFIKCCFFPSLTMV